MPFSKGQSGPARFQKGGSGNPGGRPKGATEMARFIREQTRDGAELVEFALKIWRDPAQNDKSRQWAHEWIADRGFGKPLQAVDMQLTGDLTVEQSPIDLSKLTIEQLETLAAIADEPPPLLGVPGDPGDPGDNQ